MNRSPRSTVLRSLAGLVLAGLGVAIPTHAQPVPDDPQRPAAPPETPSQAYSAQATAAATREIAITKDGPRDVAAFGDLERPFLVAQWLCVPPTDRGEAITGILDLVLGDSLLRARCSAILDDPTAGTLAADVIQRLLGFSIIVPRVLLTNSTSDLLTVEARNSQTGRPCFRVENITDGAPGTVELADIRRQCGPSARVDFAILHGTDTAQRVVSGFALSFELPALLNRGTSQTLAQPAGGCTELHRFSVRLDATGVESVRFRNPRWPLYLGSDKEADAEAFQACSELEFSNQIVTRQFVVSFSGIDAKARWDFMSVRNVTVRCPAGSCTATFRVGPGSPVRVPLSALRKAYVKTATASGTPVQPQAEVISFAISFYDDDREPTYSRGYFSLVQWRNLVERRSDSAWSSAAAFDFGSIPDLTEFDAKYAPIGMTIYDVPAATVRPNDWRAQGNVRVSLKQNLGNRAAGDFEIRLKSGEYGGADPSLTATKFRIEVYGLAQWTVSAGRAGVAAPSESIALAEAGDGIGLRYSRFQVNHLFRKQIREALPDVLDSGSLRTDREHHTTVFQATGLPISKLQASLDLYGTFGTRSQSRYALDPAQPPPQPAGSIPPPTRTDRHYGTVGGELSVALASSSRWTAAAYHSRARTKLADGTVPSLTDEGRGTAFLTTISWTNFGDEDAAKRAVDWTFQARYGRGSAEQSDPEHVNRQEAYLGESANFAPDVLFLASLSALFHAKEAIRPVLGSQEAITPGLGNKHYLGGVLNIPKFEAIARLFRKTLPQDAFGDASANVRAHMYWLRHRIEESSYLGTELDASLTLEVPKGVKSTFTAAAFEPGGALRGVRPEPRIAPGRPYVERFTWALIATVNIAIP